MQASSKPLQRLSWSERNHPGGQPFRKKQNFILAQFAGRNNKIIARHARRSFRLQALADQKILISARRLTRCQQLIRSTVR